MKAVFLPASDEILNDRSIQDMAFVPFNPAYLAPKLDKKPRNWIKPSSYEDALNRLFTAPARVA